MGIGNLESVIAPTPATTPTADRRSRRRDHLTYARALLRLAPLATARPGTCWPAFGDESSLYLWKVLASQGDPAACTATTRTRSTRPPSCATNKATLEEVFHPSNETDVFADAGRDRRRASTTATSSRSRTTGARLGARPRHRRVRRRARPVAASSTARCARRRWRRSPTWPAGRATSAATRRRCTSTSAVRDRDYQDLLVGDQPAGDDGVLAAHDRLVVRHPRATTSRDARRRRSSSCSTACGRSALIDYAVEPGAIHVTVSDTGGAAQLRRGCAGALRP